MKAAQQMLVLHPIKGDKETPKTLPLVCVNEDSRYLGIKNLSIIPAAWNYVEGLEMTSTSVCIAW